MLHFHLLLQRNYKKQQLFVRAPGHAFNSIDNPLPAPRPQEDVLAPSLTSQGHRYLCEAFRCSQRAVLGNLCKASVIVDLTACCGVGGSLPISQVRRAEACRGDRLVQCHTARRQQSQDGVPSALTQTFLLRGSGRDPGEGRGAQGTGCWQAARKPLQPSTPFTFHVKPGPTFHFSFIQPILWRIFEKPRLLPMQGQSNKNRKKLSPVDFQGSGLFPLPPPESLLSKAGTAVALICLRFLLHPPGTVPREA